MSHPVKRHSHTANPASDPTANGTTAGPRAKDGPEAMAVPRAEAVGDPPPRRSYTRNPSPDRIRIAWTTDLLWAAIRAADRKQFAAAVGCSLSNVHARVREFRASSPGGSGMRHVVDRDIHLLMGRMLDSARHEALAAVAFVSPSPPPVFDRLLSAARRGVKVRLVFRADNLTGDLVEQLRKAGVEFRVLADLHAKFLITDTTAMNGSANFTQASADRASEVATFLSDTSLVHDLRTIFYAYRERARPY